MLLSDFNISNHVHNRWCRFIIQRYLGQFLERNLSLDQLSVELSSGRVNVEDVNINVHYVNDLFAKANVPLKLVDGFIGRISIEVPWMKLISDSSRLTVDNLQLTFQAEEGVKLDDKDLVASMLGSVVESLVSSQELARSFCDEQEQEGDADMNGQDGIQAFTKIIDAIISRFCMELNETTIRLENPPHPQSDLCTALELRIDKIKFMDEQLRNCEQDGRSAETITNQPQGIGSITNLNKFLSLSGVEAFTDVFSRIDDLPMDDNSTSLVLTSMYIRREKMKQRSPTRSPNESVCPELFTSTMTSTTSFQSCHSTLPGLESMTATLSEFKVMKADPDLLSNPIKFAELVGESNVMIRFFNTTCGGEQVENKIDVEAFFKGVNVFIAPSQIEIVKRFFASVALPQSRSYNNENGKPMEEKDYDNIVRSIEINQTRHVQDFGGGNWCGHEEYREFDNVNLEDSKSLRKFSDQETTYKTLKNDSRGRRGHTRVKATIGSLLVYIPHADPLAFENVQLYQERGHHDAIEKLQTISDRFFSLGLDIGIHANSSLHKMRERADKLYQENHIRFIGSAVVCKYEMEKALSGDRVTMQMSVTNCDCIEFLTPDSNPSEPSRCHFPLLDFSQFENVERVPHLKLVCTVTGAEKLQTKVNVYLGNCRTELDLSMIDRIAELISPRPFFDDPSFGRPKRANLSRKEHLHLNEDLFAQSTTVESSHDNTWSIACEELVIDLRVPIVDLQQNISSRLPYKHRNVHPEFIQLTLKSATVELPSHEDSLNVVLQCSQVTGSFCGTSSKLSQVSDEDRCFLFGTRARVIDKVQFKFCYDPRNKSLKASSSQIQLLPDVPDMSKSISMSVLQSQPTRDGPFSQTRRQFANSDGDIIQAGSREEMEKFASDSVQLSDSVLHIEIPVLRLLLCSHPYLEVLYNRLVNDLALWQPAAPSLNPSTSDVHINVLPEKFHEYKDSERDDDDETVEESIPSSSGFDRNKSHNFSVLLNVDHGTVLLGTVLKENGMSVGNSQVAVELTGMQLFTVVGYHQDMDHTFFHFTTRKVTAGHRNHGQCAKRGLIPRNLNMKDFGKVHRDDIQLESISSADPFCDAAAGNAIAVAMHLHARPNENVKDILMAVALRNTSVHVSPFRDVGHLWVTQLVDMFNLTDYDVAGYVPPIVTSDIQVHLDNVVLAYDHATVKPDSTTRLRLVLGQTNISSAVVANNDASKLSCIFEKSKLYMSNERPKEGVRFENEPCEQDNSFFPIMDVGLFHLEVLSSLLAESELHRRATPLVEVVCKNDIIKAWICADSLVSLINVVSEISESDEIKPIPMDEEDLDSTFGEDSASEACASTWSRPASLAKPDGDNLPLPVKQQLQDMIVSASREENEKRSASECIPVGADAVEEFSNNSLNQQSKNLLADALSDDSLNRSRPYSISTDEEFCMVDDILGSGITNAAGEPTIKYIGKKLPVDDPIPINWQHFRIPDEWRTDGLGALQGSGSPPLLRYMIRDVSVELHIYGGNDFKNDDYKPCSYSVEEYRKGVGRGQKVGSDAKGGHNRDHSVAVVVEMSKITMLYQMFAKDAQVMCTTLFSIHDIVIRDMLTISKIKELMYQYSNATQLRRTCAPMLAVRIVESHTREGKLRVSMLPVKLNVDQDTMNFLEDFIEDVTSTMRLPNKVTDAVADRPLLEVPAQPRKTQPNSKLLMPQADMLNLEPLTPSPVQPMSPLGDLSYLMDRPNSHTSPVKRPLMDAPLTDSAVSIGNIFEPRSESAFRTSSSMTKSSSSDVVATEDHGGLFEVCEGNMFDDVQGDWNSTHEPIYPGLSSDSSEDLLARSTMEGSIHPSLFEDELVDTSSGVERDIDNDTSTVRDEEGTEMNVSMERAIEYDDNGQVRGDTFFKEFIFSPSVSIFIDYHGKNKLSDKGSAVLGIVKGFSQLNRTELVLKEINNRNGLLGVGKCVNFAVNEWYEDVVNNLPNVLATYGPISPLVQIGKGFLDLFWLPVAEMRKPDGHVVKGIQKGVGSFGSSSAAGVIGVVQTAVGAVQTVAEKVYYEVQPDSPFLNKRNRRAVPLTAAPTDLVRGMQLAYEIVAQGVRDTRDDLELAAQEDRASGNSSVRSMLRFATPAVLRPLVMFSQVSYQLLGGIRSQLRPDMYQDECHKWRDDEVPGSQS